MPDMDMRRMQEEAARRAREMQSRARQGRPRAPVQQPAPPPEKPAEREHPKPPPPTLPESVPPVSAPAEMAPGSSAGLLEELFKDRERTMLLALLILLGGEGGNHELMFALLFLLM